MKEDCIFCKIANGIIPSHTLYEDDKFKVIFDIGPATKGHALILPKEHFANVFEIDEDTMAKAFVLARKMAKAMKDAFGCDGFNILQNNGEIAGQSVFHFHIHLIPRYEGDNAIRFWKPGEADDDILADLEEKVKQELQK